ncbi:MAG: histidine phosphatase family protein [Ardenticatenaceae bacterium]|nr:histidine phosphatase family protein [Ardenticatenaceae bacterium]MCB9446694.1 histidine phosphatase family protein [Ardenticatenaceae bacterium]
MNWYIIRHAAKEPGDFYNPVLRHQDQPISDKGRAEARNLSAYFAGKSIAAIYVSEYGRTRQTIEHAAQNLNLSPIVDPRLNEIDNGVIEGLTDPQISQQYPDVWEAFMSRDRDFRFPQGESGEEAQQRIQSFFIEHQKRQEDIILVSHDGWIRLLMCYILGLPVYRRWDFRVDTGGIMEIAYQPEFDRWKLIRFNHQLPTIES